MKLARGVTVMLGRLVRLGRAPAAVGMLVVACLLGAGAMHPAGARAALIWAGPIAHDDIGAGPQHYGAVACATASQCTAVDELGGEVTFDPQTSTVTTAATVDAGAQAVYALACPASTQCTAVDLDGRAVVFNPRSPTSHSSAVLSRNAALLAVACPSRVQCTAVDAGRDEITFDPRKLGSSVRRVSLRTQAGTGITGLACPSVSTCVAVDGAGEVVGFNPRAPGRPKPVRLLNDSAVAVACPSAAECVVVGFGGERITFATNPKGGAPTLNPGTVSHAKVDAQQPNAVACPSLTYCVLVDAAGRAVEFDPGGSRATATSQVVAGASLSAVACETSAACVAVDSAGDAFIGGARLPAVPVATRRPRVSGKPLQGDLLKGSASRWSGVATSLHRQWERCSGSGRSCHVIAGATARRYRLTAADVGHTIRLLERAANEAGFSAAVASRATRAVSKPPSRSSAKARAGSAQAQVTAVDSWLPDVSTANWQYNWTESHYNPAPGTIETVTVQSARGAGFVLAWNGVSSAVGAPVTDQGTVSFQNTDGGLVNTNWSSAPPPPAEPILCVSRICPNSLASAYFNVIWGSRNPVLAGPLLHGASWPSRGGAGDGVLSTNTYLGDQLVRVPAFRRPVAAAVVRSKITQRRALGGPYGSGIRTTWWVYGVGPVKVVFHHDGGHAPITTVTLVATDLRPLTPPPDADYFPLGQARSGLYSYTNTRYLREPEVERVTVSPLPNGTAELTSDSVSGPIKVNGAYLFRLRLAGGVADLTGTSSATTRLKFPTLAHGLHFFTPVALMTYGFNPVLPAYPQVGDRWHSGAPGDLAFYGVTGQTTIVGLRGVRIPAGSFDALELTSTLTKPGDAYGSGVRTMWFAPGVGLVKLEFRHGDGSVSLVQLIR